VCASGFHEDDDDTNEIEDGTCVPDEPEEDADAGPSDGGE
jgi:hypothetical protein